MISEYSFTSPLGKIFKENNRLLYNVTDSNECSQGSVSQLGDQVHNFIPPQNTIKKYYSYCFDEKIEDQKFISCPRSFIHLGNGRLILNN